MNEERAEADFLILICSHRFFMAACILPGFLTPLHLDESWPRAGRACGHEAAVSVALTARTPSLLKAVQFQVHCQAVVETCQIWTRPCLSPQDPE